MHEQWQPCRRQISLGGGAPDQDADQPMPSRPAPPAFPDIDCVLADHRCRLMLGFELRDPAAIAALKAGVKAAKQATLERLCQAIQAELGKSASYTLYRSAIVELTACRQAAERTGALVDELNARKRRLLASDVQTLAAQLANLGRDSAKAVAQHDEAAAQLTAISAAVTTRRGSAGPDVHAAIDRCVHAEMVEVRRQVDEACGQLASGTAFSRLVVLHHGDREAVTTAGTLFRHVWDRDGEISPTIRAKSQQPAPPAPSAQPLVQRPTIGEVTRVAQPTAAELATDPAPVR